jgi:pimeloyl-ACP methyl ester carboxylesterase
MLVYKVTNKEILTRMILKFVVRKRLFTLVVLLILVLCPAVMAVTQPWQTLPPTPVLPKAHRCGYAPIHGIKIWYAVFGHGAPVIMLHGGLANANYWGLQVPALATHYQVIVMDSRGHGRSTRDSLPYGYDLMADDVVGLMDFLRIQKAAVVGWSDGGIIGLDIAMRYPQRVKRLLVFAANTDPSGLIQGGEKTPTFAAYLARTSEEYVRLSPTPTQYSAFSDAINQMWDKLPNFTATQLATIRIPVWVVDGDHDEIIQRQHTQAIAAAIPGATLRFQPNVSHFAFLQNPTQFTEDIRHFLAQQP